MLGIVEENVVRFGDPVAFGQPLAESLERRLVHAQRLAQRMLLGNDALAPTLLLMAQPQHFLGGLIEIAQQLSLPAVPDTRSHRANIHHGQAQQQAQPFGALHHIDEIEDCLIVRQIALEGGGRHQQMVSHQPGDRLRLRRGQAQARAKLFGHLCTQQTMIAAASLGDIVQQHRDIEGATRQQFAHQVACQRMVLRQFALFDPRQQADGADGMLVDRVMMIHVELHLRDNAAEVRHEPAEDGGFVHPAQHRFRIAR